MDDELLKRIDMHMERGNEIHRESNEIHRESQEIHRRSHEVMDRVETELRLSREQHADHMREMREARRGYRLAIKQVLRESRENRKVIRENHEAMREVRESLRDLRGQVQANTKAILALLDRFENGGASPATG